MRSSGERCWPDLKLMSPLSALQSPTNASSSSSSRSSNEYLASLGTDPGTHPLLCALMMLLAINSASSGGNELPTWMHWSSRAPTNLM